MIKRIKEDVSYYWAKAQFLALHYLKINPDHLSKLLIALVCASLLMIVCTWGTPPMNTKTLVVIGSIFYSTMIAIIVYKQGWSFPFAVIYTTVVLFAPLPTTIKLVLIVSMMIVMIPFARAMERALAISKNATNNPLYECRALESWEQMMVKVNEDRYKIGAWIVAIAILSYGVVFGAGTTNLVFTHLTALAMIWSVQTNHNICAPTVYKIMHRIVYTVAFLLFISYIVLTINYFFLCLVGTWGVSLFIALASLHSKSKVVS